MTPAPTLSALDCPTCGAAHDPAAVAGPCPDCDGPLVPDYDLDAVRDAIDPAAADATASAVSQVGLDALRPITADESLDLGEGQTPLVDAPTLADDLGVAGVTVKDEGCNPTGTVADREMAVAVAAAASHGATDVALPTMGNAGQAAAAAAARAGLDSHSFVPSRTPFVNKAMINVHGGDMSVVEGRYDDALSTFAAAIADADWHSLAPFESPYRQEGVKPLAYEVAAARGWSSPDWVVVPTGQVTTLVGVHRGFAELAALDLVDSVPRLVAAQSAGCDPVVQAHDGGADDTSAVETPDSVSGPLEIPDPAGGALALDALAETNGTAVPVADDDLMAAAASLAEAGVPTSVTGGAAVGAVCGLAERGEVASGDEVVLVNPVSANKEADLMRSYLMSQGI